MIYPGYVINWVAFVLGLAAGGLIAGLWMRARLARLEAAQQFADSSAAKLTETFQSLADTALRSNQGAFLEAARSTLDTARAQMTGDLAQKQTAIEGVVRPLNESLTRLENHVLELERARATAFGSLGEQLQSLARETSVLSTALRSPQARGRWGEVTSAGAWPNWPAWSRTATSWNRKRAKVTASEFARI